MSGHLTNEERDSFSLLDAAARTMPTALLHSASAGQPDVLDLLRQEAEAALRDPNYVSVHAMAVSAMNEPVPTSSSPEPLHVLPRAGLGNGSLLELLDGDAKTEGLTEPLESLDGHELFAVRPAPDVLRIFAGNIAPIRQQGIAAPLTRREHHLVSMDSAYRPAQAQTPEVDREA